MSDETVLLFVDALEDDDAWVLLGEKRYRIPRALLPAGSGEGAWLRLSADPSHQADVEESIEARRARLLRADPGGDIKL